MGTTDGSAEGVVFIPSPFVRFGSQVFDPGSVSRIFVEHRSRCVMRRLLTRGGREPKHER